MWSCIGNTIETMKQKAQRQRMKLQTELGIVAMIILELNVESTTLTESEK